LRSHLLSQKDKKIINDYLDHLGWKKRYRKSKKNYAIVKK
jgi:hypothetical protein